MGSLLPLRQCLDPLENGSVAGCFRSYCLASSDRIQVHIDATGQNRCFVERPRCLETLLKELFPLTILAFGAAGDGFREHLHEARDVTQPLSSQVHLPLVMEPNPQLKRLGGRQDLPGVSIVVVADATSGVPFPGHRSEKPNQVDCEASGESDCP
jgi:hypothetical protein